MPHRASAHRSPAGCTANSRLHLDLGQDNDLVRDRRRRSTTRSTPTTSAAIACHVQGVNINLQLPGLDGHPSGTLRTSSPDRPTTARDSVPARSGRIAYTVAANPGVTRGERQSLDRRRGAAGRQQQPGEHQQGDLGADLHAVDHDRQGRLQDRPAARAAERDLHVLRPQRQRSESPAGDDRAVQRDGHRRQVRQSRPTRAATPTATASSRPTEIVGFTCTLTHPAPGMYTQRRGGQRRRTSSTAAQSPSSARLTTGPWCSWPARRPPRRRGSPVVHRARRARSSRSPSSSAPCTLARANSTTVRAGS